MAAATTVITDQLVDTAIGPIRVQRAVATGFDVDDYVQSTVNSMAIAVKIYNLATTVNTQLAQNRRKVSIGGVSVGGY